MQNFQCIIFRRIRMCREKFKSALVYLLLANFMFYAVSTLNMTCSFKVKWKTRNKRYFTRSPLLFNWKSLSPLRKNIKNKMKVFLTCSIEYKRGFPPIWLSACKWHHYHTPCSNEFWCVAGKNNQTLDTPKFANRGHKHFLIAQRHFIFPIIELSHNLSL